MDLMTIRQVEGKRFSVEIRNHRVEADMHKEDGGEDGGMNPVELLVGALGACIGMMVKAYCDNHDLPSEGISLEAVPTLATNPKRIGNVAIDVTLPPGFPQDKKEAVLKFAKHCPVHSTLEHPPEIDVDIASYS
jgi:uncharacterized OsmC-like protein